MDVLSEENLREMLVAAIRAEGTATGWADKRRIHRSTVGHALSGERAFPASVANALGYRRQISFVPAGARRS